MTIAMNNEVEADALIEGAEKTPNQAVGGSALTTLLEQPPNSKKQTSLRHMVMTSKNQIRRYLDDDGSWDALVEALSADLGRPVNRKTVETYMSDFLSAKASRKAVARSVEVSTGFVAPYQADLSTTEARPSTPAFKTPIASLPNPFAPRRKAGD